MRICVPLLMRSWIMQACYTTASCHSGDTRTLCTLERFYWWVGIDVPVRKTARQTIPMAHTLPLPNSPDVVVSVDSIGGRLRYKGYPWAG